MATRVLKDLEELRQMLDSPRKTFSPLKSLHELSSPRAGLEVMKTYSTALNSAERSVDRLGRAIEAAEEEMDAAHRRTSEIHRSQLKQKELEILELQRVIGAKERSVDSLRDTLATTKRTYESKLSQAESAMALKDAEVKALAEELRVSRLERETLTMQLERAESGRRALEASAREREAELGASARAKSDEVAKIAMALRYEKKEKEDWRAQAEEMQRQLSALQEELQAVKDEVVLTKDRSELELTEARRRGTLELEETQRRCEADLDEFRRRCEAELEDMKRRLRNEKNLRKACEKWLRSELKSREEMELLLAAVKDAASGRSGIAGQAAEVEALIDRLRTSSPPPPISGLDTGAHQSPTGSPRVRPTTALAITPPTATRAMELELKRRKLEEENNRLRSELLAARRMLTDRLK